ncbi:hypothetical protein FOL47_010755 [Perkinsus chesapeaki]|uniref:Condensin complex subunit 1 C-terminal domain-containing protein n=1 Tax=Perkinsus chesapeaki TaxID=330153 RepID=A0A7J6L1I2_PERCH|nr:hypothetical protein FOL47_010755 [Perkinsus chesapeaki]
MAITLKGNGHHFPEEDRDWLRGVAKKIPEIVVRAAHDEKTSVRTVCTKLIDILIDMLQELNELVGEETLPFTLPLQETLPILGLDAAVSVRKAAIATTDRILQMLSGRHRETLERLYPAAYQGGQHERLQVKSAIPSLWCTVVLPLVSDAEQGVSDIATDIVKESVLSPLKHASRRASGLDDLSACLLRTVASHHSWVEYAQRGIKLLMRKEHNAKVACKPFVTALEKVIDETSNEEDPLLVQALWMLLEEFASIQGDVIDASLVSRTVRTYFSAEQCDPKSTFGHLCMLKAILFAMKQVSGRVEPEASKEIAELLIALIKSFTIPLTLALPVMELVQCLCNTHRATKNALKNWQKDLICQMETFVYQGAVYKPERAVDMAEDEARKLAAALGYLGDLVLVCEESGKKNVSCFLKPDSTITNIHILATDSVFSDIMSGNPKKHFRIPVPVRAQAIICLGKVCLKNEKQAKNLADVFALLLRHFEPVVVRNNAFVVLYDLCVQYTGLVDPRLPIMTRALNDEVRFYRHQAMMVISSLMAEDYVKFRGQTVYRYLTVLADDNEEIRSFVESFFTRILIPRQHGLFADVFVKSICALNCWKGHPLYANAAQNNREFSLQDRTVKRERIYRFMMEYLDETSKFKVVNEIMTRLLTRFLDEDGSSRPLPLPQTEEESGGRVLTDVFCLLACRELRLHTKSGIGGRDLGEQQGAGDENDDPNAQGEKRDAAERSKKYMQETMIPTLLQLRNLMQSETSPFVYHINNCLRELLRDFKDEIATFCNGDEQLAVELLYDLNIEGRGGLLLGRREPGNEGNGQRARGPPPLRLFDISDGHGDQMNINVALGSSDEVVPAGMTDFQKRMMQRARKKAKSYGGREAAPVLASPEGTRSRASEGTSSLQRRVEDPSEAAAEQLLNKEEASLGVSIIQSTAYCSQESEYMESAANEDDV